MNPFKEKGTPVEQQVRSWKDVAQAPYLKQEVDAFTRCRVILMNGIEVEASVFSHSFARTSQDTDLKKTLARLRLIEHQQQNTINWLNPADQSALETTIAFEQVAIELTAYLARHEPDPYVKMAFDFGLLEDFDHLYRYSQMLDLIHGKDPNEILQGRTDVFPARPTQDHHNDPALRILKNYDKTTASPITKAHALTLMAGEQQTWNFYKNIGNVYGSPEVRQLYAEISAVEEEHVTQYESLIDPTETMLEKWVMHEFNECANYYTCYMTEVDPRIKTIWEQFLSFEIEQLRIAGEYLKKMENRDPQDLCGVDLPTPATFETNREYVTKVLKETATLRLIEGGEWANVPDLPSNWPSYPYQEAMQDGGAPSEAVIAMRIGVAGAELVRTGDKAMAQEAGRVREMTLDGHDAVNTVQGYDRLPTPIQEEVARLGPLAMEIDDYRLPTNGSAGKSNGGGNGGRAKAPAGATPKAGTRPKK
jgi:rubrerythrin